MKEIGGYLELEHFNGCLFHENAVALNCGRNCLAYLIKSKHIKKIAIPFFMCDSVYEICEKYDTKVLRYHINKEFMPMNISCDNNTWVYIMNYYGQLTSHQLTSLKNKYHRIIIDNAQAYFDIPLDGVDTLYTCRKFFGVPDGAFLYTDTLLNEALPLDQSYDRMTFLLGRFERSASEFYLKYVENNDMFVGEPIKQMSKLTENLLRTVDYKMVKSIRSENYAYLHERLKEVNLLNLRFVEGAFAYPLLVKNAVMLKKKLLENKVYIPTLWPNVLTDVDKSSLDYYLAQNILPIPCDQRYSITDMKYIADFIVIK